MEMIREAIEHMWKDHRKMVIGAGVVLVILIIAALQEFMLHGLFERKHSGNVLPNPERISL